MIYLEIAYAKKDEAKSFGVRWDPKEKLWYFPGDVLPEELECFRPANAAKGPLEKIILDIPFSYRDIALKTGARWDSEIKPIFLKYGPDRRCHSSLRGSNPSGSVGKRRSRGS
jgi:hypothetical protein